MKIGILNFINAKNYGAVLQSFALKTLVEQMGMEPYIINRYAGATTKKQFYSYSFLPKFILGRLKWVCFDKFSEKYELGKNLVNSTLLYTFIAGTVILIFNLIAGSILGGLA